MTDAASPGSGTRPDHSRLARNITELLGPVATAAGFDLEGADVVPAGRRRVLRLVVDRDGGVDLDAVAVASRAFADALDDSDVMGAAPYTLEVTSPGVDRPLTEPRHWRRATGRLVQGRTRAGTEIRGRIVEADDVSVLLAGAGEPQRLAYDELERGRVEIEFSRADEGGQP